LFGMMQLRCGPLPRFLEKTAASFFGMPEVGFRDVFWAGRMPCSSRSCLTGALFLVVDRRQKVPRPALSSPLWAQPVYILERRNAGSLCGACRLEGGTLVVRPCGSRRATIHRLRHRVDAEVVGRVVGVVRKLR